MIPPLDHLSGSWIITDSKTGKAIFETFSRSVALKVNQSHYTVQTAHAYLCGLNRKESPA